MARENASETESEEAPSGVQSGAVESIFPPAYFARPQPSPSFSPPMPALPPFQLMTASTLHEYVIRVISPPSPALYVDATIVRTVLRLVARSVSATFL